jgi:23S rRNA pseudouridine2605 synthase
MEKMRLNRYLSLCGIASRRKADDIIKSGAIKVNNVLITEPGLTIELSKDIVKYRNKILKTKKYEYFIFNKPRGYVCSKGNESMRGNVYELLPGKLKHLKYVGRLDINTEGLLMFTNDGELIEKLTHPRHGITRVYAMLLKYDLSNNNILKFKHGIRYNNEFYKFTDIFKLKETKAGPYYILKLKEGKNREIRNSVKLFNNKIFWLKRIEFGPIKLGELKLGQYRPLTNSELSELKKLL